MAVLFLLLIALVVLLCIGDVPFGSSRMLSVLLFFVLLLVLLYAFGFL